MEKIKISSINFNQAIKKAVKIIKDGGVIICPTDTVYGLIADAKNEGTVKKIFQIKKRKIGEPLPIFVKDLKMAKSLAIINKNQEKFLENVWFTRPNFGKTWAGKGKVTVILKARTKKFPKGLLSKDKKIGLRIPNYKLLNILLGKLNTPLTGTSANVSGKPHSTKINRAIDQFKNQPPTTFGGGQPDLILDSGNLKPSLPSTVVDLTNFKILRKGEFPKRKILEFFKKIEN